MDIGSVGLGLAFLAGLASFLSPCVLPLVPAYVGYLSGRAVASGGSGDSNRLLTLSHGLAFVLGFSLIFILLGLGASAVGSLLFDLRPLLTKVGGVIVIVFGLHMTGIIRIPFLQYDLRRHVMPDPKLGYLSSMMLGVFFSVGWSPCVGPVLGAILTFSLSEGSLSIGAQLLASYSAGLAIPFLLAATQITLVTKIIRRYRVAMHYVEVIMGLVLIVVGAMLFTGRFERLATLGFFFGSLDEVVVGTYLLIGIIVATILGLIPAFVASRKGRSFYDWWFFGALLFPVALPLAILQKSETNKNLDDRDSPGDVKELPYSARRAGGVD